jgi:hypothetical protein
MIHYAECHILFVVMRSVIMLSVMLGVIMLSVIILSVITLSVVAPQPTHLPNEMGELATSPIWYQSQLQVYLLYL